MSGKPPKATMNPEARRGVPRPAGEGLLVRVSPIRIVEHS
jgi:hypothetical protein